MESHRPLKKMSNTPRVAMETSSWLTHPLLQEAAERRSKSLPLALSWKRFGLFGSCVVNLYLLDSRTQKNWIRDIWNKKIWSKVKLYLREKKSSLTTIKDLSISKKDKITTAKAAKFFRLVITNSIPSFWHFLKAASACSFLPPSVNWPPAGCYDRLEMLSAW